MPCHACHAMLGHAELCRAMSPHDKPCRAKPCHAEPCWKQRVQHEGHGLGTPMGDQLALTPRVPGRCVRITDTGLSYLSTMSSLRSLYLRWCCQVGVEHGCARPGSARQRGHGGTSLGMGHELRVGSWGWLNTPRLGAREQRAPVSSAGLSPGTLTLHPCPSTSIPSTLLQHQAPCPGSLLLVAQPRPSTPTLHPKSCPGILLQHPTSCSGSPPLHPGPSQFPALAPRASTSCTLLQVPSLGTRFPTPARRC